MKERAIRIGVLSVVFILAVIVFSYWTNRGNTDMTADMDVATLPTISFEVEGRQVNMLVGHVEEMNMVAMRDTIIAYDEDGVLTADIHYAGDGIEAVQYEIYTLSGKEKLYEKKLDEVGEQVHFRVADVLEKKREGILKITLTQGKRDIYYYTRIVDGDEYHMQECLEYVTGLHSDILLKQNADAVKKVMEPNAQGDNTTLQHVTIHSNMEHVLWGDLKPEVISGPSIKIQEVKKAYTSVLLQYRVKCGGDNNEEEIYSVNEFFKVSYGEERIYLIEYDRVLEEVFNPANVVLSSKGIILGLADENIPYKVNESGTIVSFVQANELWSYNKEEKTFALVFSFAEAEKEDVRNRTDSHTIQILSMEDNGNMTFSVCGYMNRGTHEGESGVAVYYYHQSQNYVEEAAFIPSTESETVIRESVQDLAYYNKGQEVLYVMAEGTLLKVEMETGERTVLMEGLQKGQYVASADGKLLAYQKVLDGKTITEIWNFATDDKREVAAETGEVVVPLGFLDSDFVYGISTAANKGIDSIGLEVQPMHRVQILNSKNKIVKTYEEPDVYVLGATIKNNMITLKQGVKNGNVYKAVSEDYITNNDASGNEHISLDSYWTDLKETQYRLVFAGGIGDKKSSTLKPKQILQEMPTVLELENKTKEEFFYVYGHGRQAGIFEEAGEAIELADKLSGVVISPNGNYAWEDGNRVSWYRNFEVSRFTSDAGESTLAACVRKVLSYEGKKVDAATELKSKSIEQVINEHTGAEAIRYRDCSVKDMFYLIDKGTPVIAMKDGSSAILLIGYDAKTVTYVEPSSGSIFSSTIEKVNEMTAGSGNTFIGYLK